MRYFMSEMVIAKKTISLIYIYISVCVCVHFYIIYAYFCDFESLYNTGTLGNFHLKP